jgi:hypothetical protein
MGAHTVILEWQYSPANFFEGPVTIPGHDYTIVIADGKAEATIVSTVYDANPSMRLALHEDLNDQFRAIQLSRHKAYKLPKPSIIRVHPDGHRDISVETEPLQSMAFIDSVDFQLMDKDGNVTSDSKRIRIEGNNSLANLIRKYRPKDELLRKLLDSYNASVELRETELVHLYEIRDALHKKFGGDTATQSKLGISPDDWKRFGNLCNGLPLRQGRHQGRHRDTALRDASEAELAEARRIALSMVKAYLDHLEKSGGTPPAP